jgi:serine/threonine protein kinase
MTPSHVQRCLLVPKKQLVSHQPDLICVGGQYRVGKLLGTGGSGEPHSDHIQLIFLSSLGSVFLGKDIRTKAEVALKIGHAGSSPLKLSYEYDVYTMISRSVGIPEVLWYGKEDLHEIIVLEYLGTSLGDLISKRQFDPRRTFLYASHMVHLLYM